MRDISETAAGKPAFRQAFQRKRCDLPADGFYEWRKDGEFEAYPVDAAVGSVKHNGPSCIRFPDA
ncbi:hypothetical protein BG53_09230 [Paenibacillus darwinianus]|uniref:Abasic site processing protein n=1 Tax=Paenibacillus darwinianus TaxID=1380763 RepID=A0A9W5W6L2_9BACL|nr:SOS response-associated peptidase family protein [Paenibacillus darwinianus]EXX85198.1 hypothetical protein BG53_09230 [Paenibacillus darwinianus]EXX89603.1 hypothetical protein CH50_01150 [Paenibacillus darwinianus]